MRNAMVVLAGIVMVGALLVGPLRGDGAAVDTCTAQGTYNLSALADAGNTVQALGFITLTQPSLCTGLGTFSAEVDVKPLGGTMTHLSFTGTYFVNADGVFTTNDTVVNLTGDVTQVAGGIANTIVFVANFGAAFSFGGPVVLAGVAVRNPPVGFIGPTGAAGAAGASGPTGAAGAGGATGAVGAGGAPGATGAVGATGAAGATGPTGATAPNRTILFGGTQGVSPSPTSASFMGPGNSLSATGSSAVYVPLPTGTVGNLRVQMNATLVGGGYTFRILKTLAGATAPTGVTGPRCDIQAGSTGTSVGGPTGSLACSDTTTVLGFSAGDLLSVEIVPTGVGPTGTVGWSATHSVP